MNIFITNSNPRLSAESLRHDKKRRGKMILESAQMLCSALSEFYEVPYKPTHKNHPCTKWVRYSKQNAEWLVEYCDCLEKIRLEEGCNPHKSYQVIKSLDLSVLPSNGLSDFVNCTDYKDLSVFTAYQKHLKDKWKKHLTTQK